MEQRKQRIWELDALRGICILGMLGIHFLFDLFYFTPFDFSLPFWYYPVKKYGHLLFVLISGVCITLGHKSLRRGIAVFSAGLLISYITLFLDIILGFENLRIWFGILHMLGLCMILYPLFRRLPVWLMGLIGVSFIALGIWFQSITVPVDFLFPLGLCSETMFVGSDYFPLFPGLGWFLIGTVLGKKVYAKKESLLPRVPSGHWLLRFFQFCGRHSLLIYLLHQPVFAGLMLLFS